MRFSSSTGGDMKALLCGLVLASSVVAHADVLWGKSELGQSVEEFKAKYPGAMRVDDPYKGKQPDGSMPLYGIAPVSIDGKEYDVSFYFLNERLVRVWLSNLSQDDRPACRSRFNNFIELLRSKYGKELKNIPAGRTGSVGSASWMNGKVDISLYSISPSEDSCRTQIIYSGRLSSEAEKL